MSVAFQQAVPILRIFSVEKGRGFYLDFLGFTWDWEHHRELTARNYRYYRPGIEDADWGARIMQVQDPFHNRLTFAERK